jgi:hypothetical protein
MTLSFLALLVVGTPAPAQTDTIVWFSQGPSAPRWAMVEETLSVGGKDENDPDYAFFAERGLAIGADGSMVVLESGLQVPSPQLRMYDPDGRFVRHLGRVGQGPGEFVRPGGVAVMPDGRFLLADLQQQRMTVYSASGEFEETWSVPFHQISDGRMWVGPDGTIALEVAGGARPDRWRAVVRIAQGGQVIDTLPAPEVPGLGESTLVISNLAIRTPYQPEARWTWHPHGYFVTARTDRYAVDLLIPRRSAEDGNRPARWRAGDPVISIRAEIESVALDPDERRDRQRELDRSMARIEGERTGSLAPVPSHKPPMDWVFAGADGRIWVRLHAESERVEPPTWTSATGEVHQGIPWRSGYVWDVFEPNGVFKARLRLPTNLSHLEFRGDEVWGFATDDLGVSTLKRYRIHWPEPRG